MRMVDAIRTKRDGGRLPDQAIREILFACARDEIPDYQMAALLMAVFFRGLDDGELAAWTDAMMHSGEVQDFSHLPGGIVDKHSTGGVGDKISIPLAPLVAACGVRVPMISGRGLGHTGGTLDKLESIPGFRTDLSVDRFRRGVEEIGACMIGQTGSVAPADRKLYALRDVTGTVESVPLISASIMSKKLAEGIRGLVLDVKVGSGAFMKTPDKARELARVLVDLGKRSGVRTRAYLTDMNQPIGWSVGNALEVEESIEVLKGEGPADTVELVEGLGAAMLVLGGVAADIGEGVRQIREAVQSRAGLEKFREMVKFQGGDPGVVDDPSLLPRARQRQEVQAGHSGFVHAIDCEKLGNACVVLGGGRSRKDDVVNPAVGLRIRARLGDRIVLGQPLVDILHDDDTGLQHAQRLVREAYVISDVPTHNGSRILEVLE